MGILYILPTFLLQPDFTMSAFYGRILFIP
jgi:hypothetical protein